MVGSWKQIVNQMNKHNPSPSCLYVFWGPHVSLFNYRISVLWTQLCGFVCLLHQWTSNLSVIRGGKKKCWMFHTFLLCPMLFYNNITIISFVMALSLSLSARPFIQSGVKTLSFMEILNHTNWHSSRSLVHGNDVMEHECHRESLQSVSFHHKLTGLSPSWVVSQRHPVPCIVHYFWP